MSLRPMRMEGLASVLRPLPQVQLKQDQSRITELPWALTTENFNGILRNLLWNVTGNEPPQKNWACGISKMTTKLTITLF